MSPDEILRHGAMTPTPTAQSKDLQSGKTKKLPKVKKTSGSFETWLLCLPAANNGYCISAL